MKKKKWIVAGVILLGIAILIATVFSQSPKWSQLSYEAIVQEIVTQPDGEVRLIVERTTEIYSDSLNSLGIGEDTKLLDTNGNNISVKDIQPGSSVKVVLKNAFTEETPFYYPVVYEIMVIAPSK